MPQLWMVSINSARTPHTWMITSLNICGIVPYNTWHPCSHASLFVSIHLICFCLSWLHIIGSFPQACLTYMCLMAPARYAAPIIVEKECGKSRTSEVLKGTRCHSWKLYLRSLIWLGLMCPPFWFSIPKYKIGCTHITQDQTNIRKPHCISWGPLSEANRKLIQLVLTTPSANCVSTQYNKQDEVSSRMVCKLIFKISNTYMNKWLITRTRTQLRAWGMEMQRKQTRQCA